MNYQRHYQRLIERAKHRSLTGYVEVHHVLPRCMGGSDDAGNLVRLTPEEHFVAHQLLHKIYPSNEKLAFALNAMLTNPYGYRKNKQYGWIKRSVAESISGKMRLVWQDSEYRKRHKAAMELVRQRPGYREQFSRIHKGRIKSAQECLNISKAKTGMKYKPMSAESRARMSEARKKVWAERRARGEHLLIAAKVKATRIKNGSYKFSDAHIAAITEANRKRTAAKEQTGASSA